jgi:hypothetical protein
MARRFWIGIALLVSARLTYGLVISAMRIDLAAMQAGNYPRFSTHILATTWILWSQIRGVQPLSHADEFGRFYAVLVFLVCPLIGFGIFWLGSQQKIGMQLWKPLAIAIIFATPLERLLRSGFSEVGLDMLWAEVIRTTLVLLLMMWSVGAMRNHSAVHEPVRIRPQK